MPKLRANSWANWTLSNAPLRPEDHKTLRLYLDWRRHGTSAQLAKREERWIVRWLCFLSERDLHFADAREEDALGLAALWDEWGWTASPRHHYIACMRSFYGYLIDRNLATVNPWSKMKGPRPKECSPRIIDPEDLVRLEDALSRPTWRDVRDRAVICTLTASACRISEALGLNVGDVDLKRRRMHIQHGKNNKERLAFLTEKAAEAIDLYLRAVRPLLTTSTTGPLFLGQHGKRLQGEIVREALRRAARQAGLSQHVWPHLLRHSVATELLEGGANLRQVQTVLGHKRLATTERYTRVALRRLHKRYDRVMSARPVRGGVGRGVRRRERATLAET